MISLIKSVVAISHTQIIFSVAYLYFVQPFEYMQNAYIYIPYVDLKTTEWIMSGWWMWVLLLYIHSCILCFKSEVEWLFGRIRSYIHVYGLVGFKWKGCDECMRFKAWTHSVISCAFFSLFPIKLLEMVPSSNVDCVFKMSRKFIILVILSHLHNFTLQ